MFELSTFFINFGFDIIYIMKPLFQTILIVLLAFCLPGETVARQSLNFVDVRDYSIKDGLSQNVVQSIVQDRDNFIWMSTWNGLDKFDGYRFRNFKSYPTDSTRLAFNRIPSITVGPGNVLWCATYDARMYIFDTREERFIDVFALHPEVKQCEEFVSKFSLPQGILWLAARDGSLWRIDGNSYRERGSLRFFQATRPERGENIHAIIDDGKGGEWVFSNRGFWVYGRDALHGLREFRHAVRHEDKIVLIGADGRLSVADIESGSISDIPIDTRIRPSSSPLLLSDGRIALVTDRGIGLLDLHNYRITDIDIPVRGDISIFYEQTKPDLDGVMWALTDEGEVMRMDLTSHTDTVLEKPYKDSSESLLMQFIHQDGRGEMWIYPLNGHLCHYDRVSGKLERAYTYGDFGKTFAPDFTLLMVDDRDNLWAGTKQGIHRFTFPSSSTRDIVNRNSECRGLMIDSKGRLWTGFKDFSISIYDPDYRYLGNLTPDGRIVNDPTQRFGASIYSFLEDSKGRIWIGSRNDGLFLATPKSDGTGFAIRNFRNRRDEPLSLSKNAVYSIYEDARGNIWVGTYGGGLNLLKEKPDGTFSFLHPYNGGLPTFPGKTCRNVRHISCSSKGEMMLSTSGGFVTFRQDFTDPARIKFHRNWCDISRDSTLSNSDVLYAMEDSRHDIWLAVMSGGICRLKGTGLLSDSLAFSYIDQRSGLPSDMVSSIQEDTSGNIWITTEKGICRFDHTDGSLQVFDNHDFHHPIIFGEVPFVIDRNGVASLGVNGGMMQLDLTRLGKSEYKPNVVFEEARVQAKDGRESTIRIKDGALDIDPGFRNISVSFVALDYCDPENISYAYRLKGFNDNWIDNGHNRTASFYALPAGDYILEVKATNSEGVWSDNIHSLPLKIRPTFIETIWAKLLYVLGFIAIGLAIWYIVVYILRLQRSISMERELTSLKLKFFTDVSHELRTPLTLIINPIDEVLADKTLNPQSREYMTLAKSNTDRMLRLINQVLDIRKIQNNKMKVYLEQVDIKAFLTKIHHDFSELARQKHIDFRLVCDIDRPIIYTDTDKIEKIVFNLLSNAFKYTPDGKRITLSASTQANGVRISVSDEGPGMEEWQKSALFRRFETFGRKRRALSSGIGLSLVKELTDILHGSISVSGKKGEGTTFTVLLPSDYETYAADTNIELIIKDSGSVTTGTDLTETYIAQGREGAANVADGDSASELRTILIVEDNDEMRRMMARILNGTYSVLEAEDGRRAIEMLSAGLHPDIIVSDIMMPEVDGLELLEKVRTNPEWSHIPFMLLSAKASVYDRIQGLECGADDYMTKPFSASYLKARIKSIIERRSRLREFFLRKDSSSESPDIPSGGDEPVAMTGKDADFIRELMRYLEENARRLDLTIDEMATALGYGRTVFNRKVKSLLDSTPVELLSSVRMKLARQLLSEGSLTVAEITYRCGFSSPQYFNRVFKAAHGCTPGEFQCRCHSAEKASS